MEERFLEIRFHYFMRKIMKHFNNSIHILDLIETYCILGNVDDTIIKRLLAQIRYANSPTLYTPEEAAFIGVSLGYSYRKITRMVGISASNVARLMKRPYLRQMYGNARRRTNERDFEEIKNFMRLIDFMKEF